MIADYHNQTISAGAYTCFADVARHAAQLSMETGQFTIAVVVGDGGISEGNVSKTIEAVRAASNYRVGFVFVGVGKPKAPKTHWALMKELDDMKNRKFDNWQSIFMENYTSEDRVALDAVAEIVNQVKLSAQLKK